LICGCDVKKGPARLQTLFGITGAPGEIRTPYPLVRSQVLYPDELRAPFEEPNYTQIRAWSNRRGEENHMWALDRLDYREQSDGA
jgi:hypothetical protein